MTGPVHDPAGAGSLLGPGLAVVRQLSESLVMRLVVAVLKPSQLEAVREALAAVHVTRLTVCDAQGYQPPLPTAEVFQDTIIEIAVNDDFLERTVETIACALAAAEPDAPAGLEGRLFVLPMDEAVQIYRDVRGPEAI